MKEDIKDMIFLIDFDGTCVPKLEIPGDVNIIDTGAAKVLKRIKSKGHKICLWTARNNSKDNPYNYIDGKFREETSIEEAIRWFEQNGISLDGINESPKEREIIGTSRKALGDIIIDDTALFIPMTSRTIKYTPYGYARPIVRKVSFVDWEKIEQELENKEII